MKRAGRTDDFRAYYENFRRYPPLSADEELRLLHIIKGLKPPPNAALDHMDRLWGAEEENEFDRFLDSVFGKSRNGKRKNGKPTAMERARARERFILHNMRLVLSRAMKFRSQGGEDVMELVSYGTDGLLRAIELFDLSRKVRFSTYAVHWIDSFIRRAVDFVDGPRNPNAKRLKKEYRRATKEITAMTGRIPDTMEVAQALDWGSTTLSEMGGMRSTNISTDIIEPAVTNDMPAADRIIQNEMIQALLEALPSLDPYEEDIIRRHYGLGFNEETLQTLASVFGVTKERIRQIENGGLEKLYIELRRFRDRN